MLTVWRRVLIVLLWLAVPLQGALAQGVCCGAGAEAGHEAHGHAHAHAPADHGDALQDPVARAAHAGVHADHAHAQSTSVSGPGSMHHGPSPSAGDVPDASDAGSAPHAHAHASASGCAHCAACCAAAALAPPGLLVLLLDVDDSPAADLAVRPHGTVPTRLERPPRSAHA